MRRPSMRADATTDKKRLVGVALVGASVGVGSIIGPASAAALVGFDLFVPLVTAGVVIVLAGFAMLLGVREKSPRPTPELPAHEGP